MILIYALAFTIMLLTFTIALALDTYNFFSKQDVITPNSQIIFPNYDDQQKSLLYPYNS